MYLQPLLPELERRYGVPREIAFTFEFTPQGFDLLRRSLRQGRAHDITLLIGIDGKFVLIRKPGYPPGVFRAPSGGVRPGETVEAGASREAYEETGLTVRLERYLLRASATFTHRGEAVPWTSHVFTARRKSGTLQPVDRREICEVRLGTLEEMQGELHEALMASGSGGLQYRAALQAAALDVLLDSAG
jgi:8-oxo-dGTP pyrophosphatase MutT (NUDIX family)